MGGNGVRPQEPAVAPADDAHTGWIDDGLVAARVTELEGGLRGLVDVVDVVGPHVAGQALGLVCLGLFTGASEGRSDENRRGSCCRGPFPPFLLELLTSPAPPRQSRWTRDS